MRLRFAHLRVTTRIGWRLVTQRRRRSALLAGAVALPVAAGMAVSTLVITAEVGPDEFANGAFGAADARVSTRDAPDGSGVALGADPRATDRDLRSLLPARTESIWETDLTTVVSAGSRTAHVDGRVIDLSHDLAGPMYRVDAGQPVDDAATVSLSSALAGALDVGPGDVVAVGRREPLTVAAVVSSRVDLSRRFLILPPSAITSGALAHGARGSADSDLELGSPRWLLGLPEGVDTRALDARLAEGGYALLLRSVAREEAPTRAAADPAGVGLGAALLAVVALFTGAAFAIVSRRLHRQAGLLACMGAGAAVRAGSLVTYSLLLGLLGAACGGVIGVAAAAGLAPFLSSRAQADWGTLQPAYGTAAALMACSVAVALLAVSGPARMLGRRDPAELLRGTGLALCGEGAKARQGQSAGLLAAAGAAVAVTAATGNPLPAVAGAVAGIAGTLRLAVSRAAAGPPDRLGAVGASVRVPLRALLALPGRTVAVASGIATVLAVAVALIVVLSAAATNQERTHLPVAPRGATLVESDRALRDDEVATLRTVPGVERDARFSVAGVPRDSSVAPTFVLTDWLACADRLEYRSRPEVLEQCAHETGEAYAFPLLGLATAAELQSLAGRPLHPDEVEAYERGVALTLAASLDGHERLTIVALPGAPGEGDRLQRVATFQARPLAAVPTYGLVPVAFVHPDPAGEAGIVARARRGSVTFLTPSDPDRPPNEDLIRAGLSPEVRGVASVVTETGPDLAGGLPRILTLLTALAGLSATGAVCVAVALWSSDLREDYLMLGAIGAPPGWRRLVGAFHGLLLGASGLLVASVWGGLAAAAFLFGQGVAASVPWGAYAALLVIVVLGAGVVGALLVPTGSRALRRPV